MPFNLKFLITDCFPETFLAVSVLAMLMLPFILKKDVPMRMYYGFIFVIISLIWFVWKSLVGTTYLFNGFFITDFSTVFFKLFVVTALCFISISYKDFLVHRDMPTEVFVMLLLHLAGAFQAISSNDFMTLFLGLELMNISLYVCLALKRNEDYTREAVSKYFVLSAIASCFILFGISWIYGLTGSTNFTTLERLFELTDYDRADLTLISFGFIIIGISFKLLLAPLHSWAPQVYKKLSFFQITLLGVVPKIIFFSVLLKISAFFMHASLKNWSFIMIGLSVASMLMGGFTALVQTNLRKFIAYSSVGQLGFVLIGFSSAAESGYTDALMYFMNYIISFFGFISLLALVERSKINLEQISDVMQMKKIGLKWIALLSLFVLNMAGLPPFPGFIFKLHLINGLILQNQYVQAFVALLYSLIAAAYYLQFIRYMFFTDCKKDSYSLLDENTEGPLKVLKSETTLIYIIILGLIVSFLMQPNFFISKSEKVISNLIFY